VVDGVSLALAEVLVLMRGAGVPVNSLRITSGGAASELWRRTIASAAGVPARRVAQREGPALGAAMLGAAMLGEQGSLGELVERWVETGPLEEPEVAESERLARLGAQLKAVRNALRGVETRRR
nr:FGGY-family carbohydrate kinase [Planctomycetota bacterium]